MRYIVAVDGSSESELAVEQAVEHAQKMGAELEVVHAVSRQVEETDDGRVIESPDEAEAEGRRVLRQATEWAADGEVDVETTLLKGRAGEVVGEYANREEVDCVFVGHRGLSPEHEEMVGSVAKRLIDATEIPVVVVGGGS